MEVYSNRPGSDFSSLISDLEEAARKSAKQRKTKVSILVNKITLKSYQEGLSESILDKLIDLIVLPNELDQSSRANLIRNLYPINKISSSVVFRVIASLGHGKSKAPYSTQAALLRWQILTHNMVKDLAVFSKVYSILFNLLDTAAIRPQLCHLLSIITRRKHVRPFRIQLLMEFIHHTGSEPALIGLFKVFKMFFPDVVVGQTMNDRAPIFKHPDPEWCDRLHEIQKRAHLQIQENLGEEDKNFRLFRGRSEYHKILLKFGVPATETSYIQETSITLDEIENIEDFIRKLDKIHIPNQLVAVLGDPLLQNFLRLKSSESDLRRIDNWLLAFFEEELLKESFEGSEDLEMLQLILSYTRSNKALPSACILYLKSMIPTWNGLRGRDIILDLLTYTPLDSFQNLYEDLFKPLEEVFLEDGLLDSKLDLIRFYTALMNRWIIGLLSQPESRESATKASITNLIEHTDDLAFTTIQLSHSISTVSIILEFYETTATLTQNKTTLQAPFHIFLPRPEIIYLLCFTSSLSILSRICGLLAIFKRVLEYGQLQIPTFCLNNFNAYLIDICNFLWRDRAFNNIDSNAKACLISPTLTNHLNHYLSNTVHSENSLTLSSLFNFSYSPVICLVATTYIIKEKEKNQLHAINDTGGNHGPITQTYLKNLRQQQKEIMSWLDYRVGVLAYLVEMGAPGISDLIYATLKNLNKSHPKKVILRNGI